MSKEKIANFLIDLTEDYLTKSKIRKERFKEKFKKNKMLHIVDFCVTIIVVIILNQYLFQIYRIPTGSMIPTIKINDTIFTDKFSYGFELLPGKYKVEGIRKPKRNEILAFENPNYIDRGPLFQLIHRFVYLMTLTMVNLDVDENKQPKAQYFVKRNMSDGGDRIRYNKGDFEIKAEGLSWQNEKDLLDQSNLNHVLNYLIDKDKYKDFLILAQNKVLQLRDIKELINDDYSIEIIDNLYYEQELNKFLFKILPYEINYANKIAKYETGWYIPHGYIFPIGDNRNNSQDARYFGPIPFKKVLGAPVFRVFPFNRLGKVDNEKVNYTI